MSMNNKCNACGYDPCRCHTTCITPVACIPPALSHRTKATSVSAQGLIDLIEEKCDAKTCSILQQEIDLLYFMLKLENYKPTKPTKPTKPIPVPVVVVAPPVAPSNQCPDGQHWDTVAKRCMLGPAPQSCPDGFHWDRVFQKCISNCPDGYYYNGTHCVQSPNPGGTVTTTSGSGTVTTSTAPDMAFQLMSGMVESFSGVLDGKYPSAILLKDQIQALWDCVYDKQQHHGDWSTNYVNRTVQSDGDDYCLKDGDNSIPTTMKIIVPVDAGSTVFNFVDGRRCLFESLVDNNITEPTKISVLEGKWLNYCDVKDVIDCVLPRELLTAANCGDACDDLNGDGVLERKTMCERMEAVEAYMLAHP